MPTLSKRIGGKIALNQSNGKQTTTTQVKMTFKLPAQASRQASKQAVTTPVHGDREGGVSETELH